MNKLVTIFWSLLLLGMVSCNEIPKTFDLSVSAQEGQDVTVVLSGCSEGAHNGYLFCRVTEGLRADQIITIHIPKVDCNRDNCALFQFFLPDGSLGLAGGFKRGETERALKLSEIIDHEVIGEDSNNEYQFKLDIRFNDKDGYEHVMSTRGLVRVWVIREGYLTMACDDPETGWSRGVRKNCQASWSTAGRTSLCGDCKVVKK